MEKEGLSALFAGVGAKGAHSWISSFIYFLAFSSLKRSWESRTKKKIGMGANLIVAALAGCCNVILTEPLDTLSTRRQITGGREREIGGGCGGGGGDGDGDGRRGHNGRREGGDEAGGDGGGAEGKRKKINVRDGASSGKGDTAFSAADRDEEEEEEEDDDDTSVHSHPVVLSKSASSVSVTRGTREDTSWASLYSGVGASLLLTINPAIQYTCFEQMRQRVIGSLAARAVRRGKKPTAVRKR